MIDSAQITNQSSAPSSSLINLPFACSVPRRFFQLECQACMVEFKAVKILVVEGIRPARNYRDSAVIRFPKL